MIDSNSSSTGTRSLLKLRNDNTLATGTTALNIQQDANADSIAVNTSDFVVKGDGKVGIGTASPTHFLAVEGTPSVLGDSRSILEIRDDTSMASGVGGGIAFSGVYTGSTVTRFASIWGEKENGTDDSYGGQLHLGTRVNNGQISSDLVIDSSGKVGIGVTDPHTTLEVNGSISCGDTQATPSGALYVRHTHATHYAAHIENVSAEKGHGLKVASNAGENDEYILTCLNGAGTNVLSATGAGNVGIGIASADQLLHIKGAVPTMLFEDSTNGNLAYIGDAVDFLTSGAVADSFGIRSEGDIRFGTGGNNLRMTIDTSGNRTSSAGYFAQAGCKIESTGLWLAGNQNYTWNVTCKDDAGQGQSFFLIAGFTHYSSAGYGAARVGMYRSRGTVMQNVSELTNVTSSLGGNWTITKSTSTNIQIKKNAGTYSGGGWGFFQLLLYEP
jgi:hypothetical protein